MPRTVVQKFCPAESTKRPFYLCIAATEVSIVKELPATMEHIIRAKEIPGAIKLICPRSCHFYH